MQAIVDAPDSQNVQELKSYLGLLSYYGKFLPNLSSVLAPLYRLLRKDYRWRWSAVERAAFKSSKELLTSSKLLVHYDLKLDLMLTVTPQPTEWGPCWLTVSQMEPSDQPVMPPALSLHQNRTISNWRRRDFRVFLA